MLIKKLQRFGATFLAGLRYYLPYRREVSEKGIAGTVYLSILPLN